MAFWDAKKNSLVDQRLQQGGKVAAGIDHSYGLDEDKNTFSNTDSIDGVGGTTEAAEADDDLKVISPTDEDTNSETAVEDEISDAPQQTESTDNPYSLNQTVAEPEIKSLSDEADYSVSVDDNMAETPAPQMDTFARPTQVEDQPVAAAAATVSLDEVDQKVRDAIVKLDQEATTRKDEIDQDIAQKKAAVQAAADQIRDGLDQIGKLAA